MPETLLTAGALVTPSIRLVRPLGHGSMGSVWIADHLGLHTQVVVKFMAPEHLDVPLTRQRFEREGALAAQAKSPHVVQVFDHGVSLMGLPYIAMELLEGEDLGKRLKRELIIDPLVFSDWLTQACKGLARAHKNRVVHRDVKPANIFLCDQDGETIVKILDFGVAKGETGADFNGTATNAALGTPFYMAPEQIIGSKSVDHRADLWALGVVTYRALTGSLPFTGDVVGALVMAITMEPAVPPSTLRPSLTRAVDAWMDKALAKSAKDRFSSAREMATAFAEAIATCEREPSIDDARESARSRKATGVDAASWPSATGTPTPAGEATAATVSGVDTSTGALRDEDQSIGTEGAVGAASAKMRRWMTLGALFGMALMTTFTVLVLRHPRPAAQAEPPVVAADGGQGRTTSTTTSTSTSTSTSTATSASASAAVLLPPAPSASASSAAPSIAPTSSPRVRPRGPKAPPKPQNPLEMPLQ